MLDQVVESSLRAIEGKLTTMVASLFFLLIERNVLFNSLRRCT